MLLMMIPARLQTVLRWVARIWGTFAFLIWGAFFVEHLQQWYSNPAHLPPGWVSVLMMFHGLLLVGLLLAWRWELAGGLTVVAAAAIFFRGALGPQFLKFFILTAIPGFLWILLAIEGWSAASRGSLRN